MTRTARLAAFAAGLAAVFAASYGVGAAVGPEPRTEREPTHDESPVDHDGTDHSRGGGGGWAP